MNNERKGSRWLRVGLLTFTLAGPLVNAIVERVRERSQILRGQAKAQQTTTPALAPTARQRLDRMMLESRQLLAEQAKQLQQVQSQARRLRKTLRKNARQGEHLLQPARKPGRNFWMIIGFSVGLVVAGITTYLFVRRQVVQQQAMEEDQSIELPQSGSLHGTTDTGRPAGEILLVDDIGTAVATLPVVDVEQMQRPEDAVFVGVASTRFYYPVDTPLEERDLVYFVSEEDARNQGFTAAEQ